MAEKITSLPARMALVKRDLASANLKKSGKNAFSKFNYFTLDDFEPTLEALCAQYGVFTYFTWSDGLAVLHVLSTDTDEHIEVPCPMVESDMKGAQPIQQLGAIQTYMRRYLFMSTFGITEHDAFDENSGNPENPPAATYHPQKNARKKVDKPAEEPRPLPEGVVEAPTMKGSWLFLLKALGYDSNLSNDMDVNKEAVRMAKEYLMEKYKTDDIRNVAPGCYADIMEYAKMLCNPVGPEGFKDEDINA